MLWKDEVVLDLKTYSKYHIDMWVTEDITNGRKWRFTGFYGDSKRSQRKESWRLLRFLRNASDLPWLCAGDFNEVLSDQEQFGGNDREEWMMEGFREVVQYCGFTDLGFSGAPFTWDNRRDGVHNIKVRLDRALADEKWLDLFGDSVVSHVQTTASDHCAIKVELQCFGRLQRPAWARPFRYENMWRRHPTYEDTVAAAWGAGCRSLSDLHANLGGLQEVLRHWDRHEFGSVCNELRKLRHRLEVIRKQSIRRGPTREERDVANRIAELLARKEAMMKQHLRVDWLHEGDRNTGFFHAKAKQRTRANKILLLKRPDGSTTSQQEELEALAADFYKHLFHAQENTNPDEVTRFVPRKVTDGMNSFLCAPFSAREVEKALFSMKPNKSPGPDGFTVGFYQKHWSMVKEDVCRAVLTFLNGGGHA
jgi:hypothetical protein